MSLEYILWGGTGQSIVLEEIIRSQNGKVIAIFDKNPNISKSFDDVDYFLGQESIELALKKFEGKQIHFAIAIGGSNGKDRLQLLDSIKKLGFLNASLIHNTAYISESAIVHEGCQILARSAVCARVVIGKGTIINTNCSVDHECIIGEGTHIAPGATIAGNVHIEANCFIGAGAVILPHLKIGENSIIGAGSVLTKSVPKNSIFWGTPAKFQRKNDE